LADPEVERTLPREELETASSLVQGSPKRNPAIAPRKLALRHPLQLNDRWAAPV
jgi:hypothetical protein